MPLRLSNECLEVAKAFPGRQGSVFGVPGGVLECLGVFWGCWRVYPCFERYLGGFLLDSHQFPLSTNKSTDIFQKTWRFQMSHISKCPRVTVILSYREASEEVSKLKYKSLLFNTSRRSYCSMFTPACVLSLFALQNCSTCCTVQLLQCNCIVCLIVAFVCLFVA